MSHTSKHYFTTGFSNIRTSWNKLAVGFISAKLLETCNGGWFIQKSHLELLFCAIFFLPLLLPLQCCYVGG